LNLNSEHKKWEILEVGYLDSQTAFGYICNGSKIYIFGGLSFSGHTNQLVELNLESSGEITVLSESIRIPTPRYGHGMIVYDEKLLIFGGVDKYENE
jgi:N-acetylneuraminic acid mutarotase